MCLSMRGLGVLCVSCLQAHGVLAVGIGIMAVYSGSTEDVGTV